MHKITFNDRFQYWFDNFMSKGTIALIGGLSIISLVIIIIAASILVITGVSPEGGESLSFFEAAWESLMRTLDAGTMGGDTGWGFRFVMFGVTIGGVFIISTLIGILTSGIENKMEILRKGRSRVIEENHTVILGWSEQVYSIIKELATANANQHDSCITILANKDKVEMEDAIHEADINNGKTRIVCRTGNPIDINDLDIVNLQTSKSIIILSSENENPDADVIKTILAITNNPARRQQPYHIVAEIRDLKNLSVAKMVGKDEVELLLVGDLIARIIAQTCRQSGLSIVYTELLDFGGDEIYFKSEPSLVGKKFAEALFAYNDSAVIGLHKPGKGTYLNPPMDTLIEAGESLIAISEDDDTINLSGITDFGIDHSLIQPQGHESLPLPELTLILGWNWRVPTIIRELDNYVPKGSLVNIVSNYSEDEICVSSICEQLKNKNISYIEGDTSDRSVLDNLDIKKFNHIILLSYSDKLDAQQADANTLITLLHLRDIAEKSQADFSITSEMIDLRNRKLAEVTQADDFIVSDQLISLMLSQVSENKQLNAVLMDIFDPEGSEIYLKPASNYIKQETPVNFYTVIEAARQRNEIAIGYRISADSKNAEKSFGVVINPPKNNHISLSSADYIIVIAEE